MRAWLLLLSGLLIWTAHFFGIYIAASLFPGTSLAKWLTGLLTFVALGLLAAVLYLVKRRLEGRENDDQSLWGDRLTLLGGGLSAIAILYQGMPALTA
jgi:membrane protein implicated in regulation of membrane protease activity